METQSSATNSSTPTVNKDSYDDPYYFSQDDHPGVILVSDLLSGVADFDSWHRSMVTALKSCNKLGFVDGSLSKPSDGSCDIARWSRCNDVVRSWLMNSVSKPIAQSILYVKTARKIWKTLLKRFKLNNGLRLYQIEHELHGLRQGSLDVNTFYKKVVTIWENLKNAQDYPACECANCECKLDRKWMDLFERSFVFKFLLGLNKSYENIRQKIIMINPLPDLEKTLSLVIQHERKIRSKQPTQSESVDFQASLTPVMGTAGLSHNNAGQTVAAIPTGFRHYSILVCTHCGLQGHTINQCYKLHGYPPGYKVSYPTQNGFSTSKQFQNTLPYRPQTPHFQGHQNTLPCRPQTPHFQGHQSQHFSRPRGPYQQGNMVAHVNIESPVVQEHFHHMSNTFTQLHLNQAKQLDMQLGTQAQNSKPVITESIGTQKISTSAAKSKNFPAMRFGGKILYSKTASEVDKRATQLLKVLETKRDEAGKAIVGFDIEWRPSFRKGVLPGKVAVVQICVDNDYCDVMHIIHSGVPESLKHLIEDSTIVKVGVGIDGDSVKLFHDHGVSIKDVEDLSDLANKKLSGDSKRWGLASLTETLVCKVLLKPNNIRLGNWESYPLSTKQLQYAATDAYASWHLYQVLKELPDAIDSSSHEKESLEG